MQPLCYNQNKRAARTLSKRLGVRESPVAADNESRVTLSRAVILRETEGLTACLRQDPAEVLRWKDEHPLRLVAAALLDVELRKLKRGRASKENLKDKLVPGVIASDNWDNWWKVVQPALRDTQDFDYDQRGGTKPSRTAPSAIVPVTFGELSSSARKTRAPADGVPTKSSTSSARLIEWITWVQADETLAIPKGTLPTGLPELMRRHPASRVPTAVERLSRGIDERVLGANQPPKTSNEWVKSLAAALSRWLEISPAIPRGSVSEIVGMTMRLSDALEPGDCESLFQWFADYMSADIPNAKIMANAILASSRAAPSDTTTLLEEIHQLLGEPARKTFWQNLITSGIGQSGDWLNNRWRNMPSDSEKAEVAASLLASARDADSIGDLDTLLSDMWNMAETDLRAHLFNPILMGWILHREMMPKVESVLRKFAEEIGNDGGQDTESAAGLPHENPIMRQWRETVKAASQNEIGRLRAEHQREIAEKDRLLIAAESNLEQADRREEYLQGELRKAAYVAGLRFNRDAIMILGEWLKDLSVSPIASHPEIRNVEDKISSTLMALGAKPFGEIGKIVPFEPSLHEANPSPPAGAPVKIAAPGVSYFRDVDAPYMMVKIKVEVE